MKKILHGSFYTFVGDIPADKIVLALESRIKVVAIVPERLAAAGPGGDVDPDEFEVALRKAVAERLVGLEVNGFSVCGATVEQFEDAGG